jgi:hypothetical protein
VGENVSESFVLRNWALAECSNPERWQQLGQVVPAHLVERLRDELPVDEQEWTFLENIMRQFRSPMLDGLRSLQPQWQTAVLEVADLRSVRIIRHQPFLHACPSGTLSELATAVNLGHAVGDGSFNVAVSKMADTFHPSKTRGRPIFVAEAQNEPWYLVEGYTLCTAMLLCANAAGKLPESMAVHVILGIVPQLRYWSWYAPNTAC